MCKHAMKEAMILHTLQKVANFKSLIFFYLHYKCTCHTLSYLGTLRQFCHLNLTIFRYLNLSVLTLTPNGFDA